jgi:hypothetical protein
VSDLLSEARIDFDESEITTPRLRVTGRRVLFWVVMAVLLLLFAAVTFALTGSTQDKARLSATNPHGNGAEALIAVLRGDGVQVTTPRTIGDAEQDAGGHPATTTLVVYDQNSVLAKSQFSRLSAVARRIILIEPDEAALEALAPSVSHAGALAETVRAAGCRLAAARAAGTVSGLARGYRITARAADATGCFGAGGVYALVRVEQPGTAGHPASTVTVLGTTTTFTNGSIEQRGNAALGLGLFGGTKNLVWYLPSFADANVVQDGVLPNPPWVLWAIVLAGLVLVAAGVWRGRRFGPVVVERMPVFVRSSETLEGRARLYQRSSARTHALDALRIGAIGRMATRCGLSSRAELDEVVGAISRATGRPVPGLKALLVDTLPTRDSDLIRLSDELAALEAEVAAAVA